MKGQKGFLPIWIIIVIIVAVLAGGAAVVSTRRAAPQPTPEPSVVSPTETPYPSSEVEKPALDETANWQTYRNEKYGFEVKYPPELGEIEISSSTEPMPSISIYFWEPESIFVAGGRYHRGYFVIRIFQSHGRTLDEWLAEYYRDRERLLSVKTKPSTYNGYPAISVFDPVAFAGCEVDYRAVLHGNFIYRLPHENCTNEAIESTFRFTK